MACKITMKLTNLDKRNTDKAAHVVTSIKQPPVLKGNLSLSCHLTVQCIMT